MRNLLRVQNFLPVIAVLAVALGVLVAIAATQEPPGNNPIETTTDIGARWDPYANDGTLVPATFQPAMSADEAIAKAKAYLLNRDNWDADALRLPVRTTIGLFTGQTEDGGPWVENLKARVVVFDNLPLVKSGPPTRDSVPYAGMVRFTMVIDDATGKFVYGTIIGGAKG